MVGRGSRNPFGGTVLTCLLAAGCASPNPLPISGETAIIQRDVVVSRCQKQARRDTQANGADWSWPQIAAFDDEVVACMRSAGF
jgi:hypothetical protein